MPVFLHAVGIQYYRGIGPDFQYIHPFSSMNFFVGPNNSGKSIILNFLQERLPFGEGTKTFGLDENSVEVFRGEQSGTCVGAVGIPTSVLVKAFDEIIKAAPQRRTNPKQTLKSIAEKLSQAGLLWLIREGTDQTPHLLHEVSIKSAMTWNHQQEWYELWTLLKRATGGDFQRNWVPDTIKAIVKNARPKFPVSMLIPAKRQLGPKDQTFDDLSGKGLIDYLAEIQNPDHHERDRKKTFDRINAFLKTVTGKPDAKLEVPSNRQHLLVHMDNKVLPLSSLGTGIHEVILIAAFCTIHQEKIMCIEEPEIHLHPILQRKLVKYLQENTKNQYFIATHSAAFIDTPNASVFRVHNNGVQTYVTPAALKSDKRRIVDELGYRASDIMQANAVVWVEGPSDRIYLRHWLKQAAPELEEGIHYSVLFYGGGLISHLSADDEAIEDFIRLKELNRNLAIVIDSDKNKPHARLKPAAQRILKEMNDGDGLVWITKGREIENYVDPATLHEALKIRHSSIYKEPSEVGQYDHAFHFVRNRATDPKDEVYTNADKVGVARLVCENPANLSMLDLKARISDLAGMIRKANSLSENSGKN